MSQVTCKVELETRVARKYNIFISHSWAHGDAYDKLISMLERRNNFFFKDYSVPQDDPIHDAPTSRALYDAIKRQMAPASLVLIMAGVYSSYSDWIGQEIKIANEDFKFVKPIVGIKPWANKNVSTVVQDNADVLVGWNTESIVQAIRDYAI